MQAVEGMQILIDLHDKAFQEGWEAVRDRMTPEERDRYSVAVAVCVAMLNTALPVAKFRAFVEVDPDSPKTSSPRGTVVGEYTVCAVNSDGIRSGLSSLGSLDLNIRCLVFEQRQAGADVVSGFQGSTKSQAYRGWYRSLVEIDKQPTVQ